jgi:LEM3 (ligand-effect modulator 3) family / CDC50 family
VRKFWGKINGDLKQGDIVRISIGHAYNVYDFNGKKQVLLATQGPLGTRNVAFGVIWLGAGVIMAIITTLFVVIGRRQFTGGGRTAWLQKRWDASCQNTS